MNPVSLVNVLESQRESLTIPRYFLSYGESSAFGPTGESPENMSRRCSLAIESDIGGWLVRWSTAIRTSKVKAHDWYQHVTERLLT